MSIPVNNGGWPTEAYIARCRGRLERRLRELCDRALLMAAVTGDLHYTPGGYWHVAHCARTPGGTPKEYVKTEVVEALVWNGLLEPPRRERFKECIKVSLTPIGWEEVRQRTFGPAEGRRDRYGGSA